MNLLKLSPDFDADYLECKGALTDWSAAANRLFASGCEAQGFALLASFAAPLMSLFRTNEGGAVVSIWGGKKSGKSIAHAACDSVWGTVDQCNLAPHAGPMRYVKLTQLCNMPALDDSLGGRDPEIVHTFLENVVRRTKEPAWQTILISFSPRALGDVPGVEVQVGVPKALHADHAKGRDPLAFDLLNNRGNAGVAYLRWLTQEVNQKWARKALASQMAEMVEDYPSLDSERFTMRAIAACHVAGQITATLGILEFEPDRITRWVRDQAFGAKTPQPQPAG